MSLPLTVCMPVYNSASYLSQAIESVLSQSYSDFELLIVDDSSNDGSRQISEAYANKDKRIKLILNSKNRGMVPNWNYCIESSKGRYIKFLFGDDYFLANDTLARLKSVLDKSPSVTLVSSSRLVVDDKGNKIGEWQGFRELDCQDSAKVAQACLELFYLKEGRLKFGCLKNLVGEPSAVMFRKEHALRGFNPEFRQFVDLEMWFQLFRQGDFAYIAEPLVAFRKHSGQQTNINTREMVYLWEYLELIKQNVRFAYPFIFPPLDRYLLMFECYRTHNLNRRDGFFTDEVTRNSIARVISPAVYRLQLPLFLALLPFYKLAAKFFAKSLTSYRDILPDLPLA